MAKRNPLTTTKSRRPVEYIPPTPDEIDHYAMTVCRELGEKFDSNYNSPDVRRELAEFLKVIVSICAKQLNKETMGALDKDKS